MFKFYYISAFIVISVPYVSLELQFDSVRIKNLSLTKCSDGNNYPVIISNVSLVIEEKSRIICSGIIESTVDLKSPIKGTVKVEVKHFDIWIKLPCEDNVGSCVYNDLCKFGYPQDKICPKVLYDNNVPCRCPIAKGIYIIKPVLSLQLPKTSIYEGKYWANITIDDSRELLSCYIVTFELFDGNEAKKHLNIESNSILD